MFGYNMYCTTISYGFIFTYRTKKVGFYNIINRISSSSIIDIQVLYGHHQGVNSLNSNASQKKSKKKRKTHLFASFIVICGYYSPVYIYVYTSIRFRNRPFYPPRTYKAYLRTIECRNRSAGNRQDIRNDILSVNATRYTIYVIHDA